MNCKPGDIAFIISSRVSENIGRVVEVIEWDACCEMWVIHCREPIRLYSGGMSTEAFCEDSRLRPISGVPVTDDVKDEVHA
ncbi:hypothetical protein [Burkholderia ubonensis]|uniref:hypothetical protein n=1 Tax=Burkholderia ubonensis TaxID=101571 RepID=UPI0007542608|nr:hypothetical protein [Burkholderia ubonensis]KVO11741.1 hypothetical protein WJ73_19530 [Burkholderia ubonensis]